MGVVVHGITGRMGGVAHRALRELAARGGVPVGRDVVIPVPIGLGRDAARLAAYARRTGLGDVHTCLASAYQRARDINPRFQVYHNTVATGARGATLLGALRELDPATTGVFCEKPIGANYREGREVVEALERGGFAHGVVHDALQTPGFRAAAELMPALEPLHCQMLFGYEVGDGRSADPGYRGQRPDFNWRLAEAGGGIALDMCHEAYISHALFGATERLSAVARLLVPERISAETGAAIHCDVEDFLALRREHASGVVNTSVWTWCRRINSEFGPLEITVEGRRGSVIFGFRGAKVQWAEAAPALRWEDLLEGRQADWRAHWEYLKTEDCNAFAVELASFIRCLVQGEHYPYDATRALDWLGEVEAIYQSAARHGTPISRDQFLRYPDHVPPGWRPERLEGLLGARRARAPAEAPSASGRG